MESDFPLPGISGAPSGAEHRVQIRLGQPPDVLRSWSGGGAVIWETVLGDGVRLSYETGAAGDHRLVYGGACFHITPDADIVVCGVKDRADFAWQRQLLDTVLFSVSFARGFELLHASAVATTSGAAAFVGPTGAGKSSLLVELIRRGYRLLSDDVLAISPDERSIMSFPAPAVMNLPAGRARPQELGAELIWPFRDENELWVVVPNAATESLPLINLFVLDLAAREPGVSLITDATFLEIAPYAISLPHGTARARRRFEVLSSLADHVSMNRLSRGADGTPGQLADLVERSLGIQP